MRFYAGLYVISVIISWIITRGGIQIKEDEDDFLAGLAIFIPFLNLPISITNYIIKYFDLPRYIEINELKRILQRFFMERIFLFKPKEKEKKNAPNKEIKNYE